MRLLHRAGADVCLSALNKQTAATVAAERGKVSADLSGVRQSELCSQDDAKMRM